MSSESVGSGRGVNGFAGVLSSIPLSAGLLVAALVAWVVVSLGIAAARIRHRQV